MKRNANFQSAILLTLLIVAGILSPSNGIEDRVSKSPMELISTMFLVILMAITLYIFWGGINKLLRLVKINK